MKIKNLLLVAAVAGITFTSCDLEDLGSTSVNTELEVDMPLQEDTKKTASLDEGNFAFYAEGVVDLSENQDVKDQIDKIKEMSAEGAKFVVEGLPDGGLIYSITVAASIKKGENHDYDILTFSSEEGVGNGSEVTLSASEIAKLNEAYTKWETLGFDGATATFVGVGISNFDITKVTSAPKLKGIFDTSISVSL